MSNDFNNICHTTIIVNRAREFAGPVDVTDPCYPHDSKGRLNKIPIVPGKYVCVAERLQYDGHWDGDGVYDAYDFHDDRISCIGIIRTDVIPELQDAEMWPYESENTFPFLGADYSRPDDIPAPEYIGYIAVDAGLAGFFCDKPDYSDAEWGTFCDKLTRQDSDGGHHVYDFPDINGFFSSSGYGDGCYDVYGVKDASQRWCALFIEFISDDDEDEEEEKEHKTAVIALSSEEKAVVQHYLDACKNGPSLLHDDTDIVQRHWEEFWQKDTGPCAGESTFTVTAKFDDGYQMDVKLCGCQDSEPWTEAVLFNKCGSECGCTDPGDVDDMVGEWSIEYDGVVYEVTVG